MLRLNLIVLFFLMSIVCFCQSAYIPNTGDNTISVISLATNTVTSTIPVGTSPNPISVSTGGSAVYVGNTGSNSISVIQTSSNTVIATIPLGFSPSGICVSPNGQKLYVAKNNGTEICVYSTSTNTLLNTIPVGSHPQGITITPNGSKIYVSNTESQTISVIDASLNEVTATIIYFSFPWGICMNPDGNRMYATNIGSGVAQINTSTDYITSGITVPEYTDQVAISANGHRMCAISASSNSAVIIDPNPIYPLYTAYVDNGPSGIDLNPDGTKIYVISQFGNFVKVISTATYNTVATIPVGNNPAAFGKFISFNQQVGINDSEFQKADIAAVYPNPAIDQFTVEFEVNQKNASIQVLNEMGEELKCIPFSGSKLILDRGDLKAGIYFIRLMDSKGHSTTKKIILN